MTTLKIAAVARTQRQRHTATKVNPGSASNLRMLKRRSCTTFALFFPYWFFFFGLWPLVFVL